MPSKKKIGTNDVVMSCYKKKITGKILSKFEEVVSPFFPKHVIIQ